MMKIRSGDIAVIAQEAKVSCSTRLCCFFILVPIVIAPIEVSSTSNVQPHPNNFGAAPRPQADAFPVEVSLKFLLSLETDHFPRTTQHQDPGNHSVTVSVVLWRGTCRSASTLWLQCQPRPGQHLPAA